MAKDVIIIGAGILGVATAYHLAKAGAGRVSVLDRRCLGAGATGRSGALVRSNYDNETEARLAEASLDVFANFADAVGGSCGYEQVGLLVPFAQKGVDQAKALTAQQRQWGVDIRLVDRGEAKALSPHLRLDDTAILAYQPRAGYCDANATARSYYDRARDLGVTFEFDCRVRSVLTQAGKVWGVETSKGTLATGTVVAALGAWSNQLLLPLGLDLGLVPRLSRVAVFRPYEFEDAVPFPIMIDPIQEAWFRPMPGGSILVGAERGGKVGIDPERIPSVAPDRLIGLYRSTLTHRFAVAAHAAPRGAWAGAFMLSPDHRPLLGAVPQLLGLYLAGGDSGGAFKTAPAMALGLAETILHGAARSVDIADLGVERLSGIALDALERPRGTISR
jgi:sarcosine oxidase, subunit beta